MKKNFIKWEKSLSVGIKEIDEQHKHFIGIVNSVYININKKGKEIIPIKELDDLIEYARIHFSTEENYFKKVGYPYSKEHMIEHEKLTLKVLRFSERAARGENVSLVLLEFLKDWLENHLKIHDKKYAKYFKENKLI